MSRLHTRMRTSPRKLTLFTGVALSLGLLAGCDENGKFNLAAANLGNANAETSNQPAKSTKLVERDVEAPEVFSATDEGLWDGRPSLGGVWVAHPDVSDPERVIIRNTANNKFVIGALFRRERDLPGPKLQISSDAAAALGILAGAPAPLNVTALVREEAPEELPEEVVPGPVEVTIVDPPAEVSETALDPIAAAGAAIDNAAPTPAAAPAIPTPAPKPAPAPAPSKPKTSNLAKPFVQIGIFSVEANAERTANQMRTAGMVPTVKKSTANNKPFWRVLVGPAQNKSELNSITKKIKAEGFSDAYAVSN